MNFCTFFLQTSAKDSRETLLYSTHKRPLLLESQNNRSLVKLKHFTKTEDREKHFHPSTMRDSFQYAPRGTCDHLRHPKHAQRY